ncbi:hypothetical protein AcV5_005799 [Taiwanofungus camphoratus]|nr:hypothetical protein AcV5_005799 [Antrodia cinnamomea]
MVWKLLDGERRLLWMEKGGMRKGEEEEGGYEEGGKEQSWWLKGKERLMEGKADGRAGIETL